MFKKRRERQQPQSKYETVESTSSEVFEKAKKSSDFSTISPLENNHSIQISFYKTLIDSNILQQSVLPFLKEKASNIKELSDIQHIVPIEDITIMNDPIEVEKALHEGSIAIYFNDNMDE